jgi:hypothetical protein
LQTLSFARATEEEGKACDIRRGLDISNNIIRHHDAGSPHQDPSSMNGFVHSLVTLSLQDDTVVLQSLDSKLSGLQLLRDKFLGGAQFLDGRVFGGQQLSKSQNFILRCLQLVAVMV